MTASTSINDLAQQIRGSHGIDTLDAAVGVVTIHVEQISDDPDLWDDATRTLSPAGVDLVTNAIAETYNIGAVATGAAQILVQIAEISAVMEETVRRHAELLAERDSLIRAALRTELRRTDIAAAARVKEARLYQIRDDRR